MWQGEGKVCFFSLWEGLVLESPNPAVLKGGGQHAAGSGASCPSTRDQSPPGQGVTSQAGGLQTPSIPLSLSALRFLGNKTNETTDGMIPKLCSPMSSSVVHTHLNRIWFSWCYSEATREGGRPASCDTSPRVPTGHGHCWGAPWQGCWWRCFLGA